MISRLATKQNVSPEDFQPSMDGLKVIGAFNPGVAQFGDEIILLVRVAESPIETRDGWVGSPQATLDKNKPIEIEWHKTSDDRDYRKPLVTNGLRRLSYLSHLEVVHLNSDDFSINKIEKIPSLYPTETWEIFGLEDARITKINDTYIITYVAVSDQLGVVTAIMTTTDFTTFTRHGVIFPWEDKDVVLFPNQINGHFMALHRPNGKTPMRRPGIWSAFSPDLIHWGQHSSVLEVGENNWDDFKVGMGPPPLLTPEGWLYVYHGVTQAIANNPIGQYRIGAALGDKDNPTRLIARTNDPILEPTEPFELAGYSPHVVFPTGLVTDRNDQDKVHLFYGAADTSVGMTTLSHKEIFAALNQI